MTKKIVVALALVMSSSAFAGSVNNSIDTSINAGKASINGSKASRDFSVRSIGASIAVSQVASRVAQSTIQFLNDMAIKGIKSSRQFSVSSIDSTVGSTDSKTLDLVADGLKVSVRVPSALALGIVKGENLILTRASQGVFVLSRETGETAQHLLQFRLTDALGTALMAPVETIKAMTNDVDELN